MADKQMRYAQPTRLAELMGPRQLLIRVVPSDNYGYIKSLEIRGDHTPFEPAPSVRRRRRAHPDPDSKNVRR